MNPRAITPNIVRDRLRAALAMRVGRDKPYTPEMVEAAAGIAARTVKAYRGEGVDPSLTAFLRMCALFGPEFANELIEIAGLTGTEPTEAPGLDGHELLTQSAHMTAELVDIMADGIIDHVERPKLLRTLSKMQGAIKRATAALRRNGGQ